MTPKSPGRKPKWTHSQIQQAWKDLRAEKPTATKTDLAKLLDMSVSRVRAIVNNHPSEQKRSARINPVQPTKPKEIVEEKRYKASGLQFYASGWNGWE